MIIGEKWISYVEDNKLKFLLEFDEKGLYETLKGLDLSKFTFEIVEGYRESTDDPLENFFSYQLTYHVDEDGNQVTIHLNPDLMPFVTKENIWKKEEKTINFKDYFKTSEQESYILETIFFDFCDSIRK